MNWFLIFVVAVILLLSFIGYKKGMIKLVLSLISIVITLILVCIFTPILTNVLKNNTLIYEKIYSSVEEQLHIEDVFDNGDQGEIIEELKLPEAIKDILTENNTVEKYAQLGVNSFNAYIVASVTDVIFNALVFSASFVVAFIVVRIVFGMINLLSKLPGINQVNKMAGTIIGFVEGVMVVWLVMAVVTMLGNTELGKDIFEQINDSQVLTFIYRYNVIVKYLLHI